MKAPDDVALLFQLKLDLQEIRLLARQIKTEEAFHAMLQQVLDPEMRRQVQRLLRPLLGFCAPHGE